ncbi:conserved Plasmodium protein, unknown function [Plasmodium knowlesi strain H]|uniref:Uncharacterized protein n=3 Tax=Plasmodium knowlesi TaxID=5850 RepID=A0A5K1U0Z7_PLAKH|nr:conserved Plasmodium protein, unknown function [Plasmodium knowlesi strain H]OTN63969.1 Uncharacterized protein PKNOH_S140265200 [Plasmodium knowlesi]CAA9991066.1 conserved Plasmodium protein, unknown function [Plasmodium knowlesi strain H]SBO20644.1 conserved Plasmodium protein, unknown function [Plasmodium knowlesi strain H]SBO21058.1 conserved Plasmodium protein, unknown function [Plasmodium knowlesi strain H]VVS80540.1 conserved Plasmodium protein, unknown function [Plasmodium knowlesi |eukprot:XP_002262348.1 hypothetical protein, conserved in Plasmodium species [Plasmodium knowlesi strain H]
MHSAEEDEKSDHQAHLKDEDPQDINTLEEDVGEINPRTSGTTPFEEEEKADLKREEQEDVSSLHHSDILDFYFHDKSEGEPNRGSGVGNSVDHERVVNDEPVEHCSDGNHHKDEKDDEGDGSSDKATPKNCVNGDSAAEPGARDPFLLGVREDADMDISINQEKERSCIPPNEASENSYEAVQVKVHNVDLMDADSNALEEMNEGRSEKSDDGKMKMKIHNLLKLIGLLKAQINQKDHEIYQMELDFKLKNQQCDRSSGHLNDMFVENDTFSDNTEGASGGPASMSGGVGVAGGRSCPEGGDFLMRKMKSILISQNEEIVSLNEELKKKTKELFFLNEENMTKNEKLAELKKEIEENYLHLRAYKNVKNEMEIDANNKVHRVENYLNVTNQKLLKNDISIKEKRLNIEKQKRVIKELYNQLNKKEEKITELRSIIESIELNNNRDIIKYKQSNTDLINRLSLNNSLMNSQKIEIENMHMNYKQLEEELKNKDNELKKLHENLLAKDEENNKMVHDINRLKFDMEIKNIDVVNVKQKIKHVKKECAIHLKKQKEHFTSVINEIYKEKDEAIQGHVEEFAKLSAHYNEVLAANETIQNELNILKDEVLKKACEVEKLQDRLLDYESKLLIYENNNEIKILKKNEDHLRKLLSKHIHRNEKLLNTTLLLQKSTLENNTLEKKIIELKAKTYRKDQEIKKLQETNCKKKNSIRNSNISQRDDSIELSDHLKDHYSSGERRRIAPDSLMQYTDDCLGARNNMLDYNNGAEKNNALDAMLFEGESNLIMGVKDDAGSEVSLPLGTPVATNSAFADDPVYVALCEFSHSIKETNIPFQMKKINGNLYLLNGKEVLIKFINGDLYVEDGSHLVKLNDFLLTNGPS